jgi:hypothetical protein
VALDGKPLASSGRILLQVMSEEKASGFTTEPAGSGKQRITNIGSDPWLIRALAGEVRFTRPDAAELPVTPLDGNGMPLERKGNAGRIVLQPAVAYYIIGS